MIGDNIKKIMTKQGITGKDLAKEVGITSTYLSYILNNKRKNPSMETLQKIANALDVNLNDLLKDSDTCSENPINSTVETIAAHLATKNITPKKAKLLKDYIDALFDEEF